VVRSVEGLVPARAVLQKLTLSESENLPSPVQISHSVSDPPLDAVPAKQSPQTVSDVGEQALAMYLPAAQVVHVEQPTAPSPLNSPSPQEVQSVAPPIENVPAVQATTPVRTVSETGLNPAGADLQ